MKMKLLPVVLFISGAAVFSATAAYAADAYPSKPIKLFIGFPPGGPTDIIGRVIGQSLSKELGQPIVIENRPGAGGSIGAAAVAKSRPDGYTLLVGVESSQTRGQILNAKLPYDQVKDFAYIRKVAKQRNLIVVNPKFPVNNVKELIAYLKAHPTEVNTGGTFGATSHIGGTLFDLLNGTKMTFVNYPGGAQPITDLVAGVLQVGFFTESTVSQHVNSGKLKALAVAAPERSSEYPNLPTVEESGGKRMDLSPWFGIVAPAGTPSDITEKIGKALDKVIVNEEFLAQLKRIGAVPVNASTADSYTRDIGEEIKYWNKWTAEAKVNLVN